MGIVKEFREFALKGNVLDLAVGVIIGGAFGKIINSMINDVIMPIVSMRGQADFSQLYIPLNSKAAEGIKAAEAALANGESVKLADARAFGSVFAYGSFITEVINFLILAMCVFIIVKVFNTARKKFEKEKEAPAPVPAGPTKEELLLTEIRDILARRA